MIERRIQVEPGAALILDEMDGAVTIGGWDESTVLVQLNRERPDTLQVQKSAAGPVVSAQGPCTIQVPAGLPVRVRSVRANLTAQGLRALDVEQVRGNLKLTDVGEAVIAEVYGHLSAVETGPLRLVGTVYGNASLQSVLGAELQNVRGNLKVKAAGHLRVSRTGGNLRARSIEGKLDAGQIGGNASLADVQGPCSLDKIAGNLKARDLTGGVQATRIGGNLVWAGRLGAGRSYDLRADGNALLRFAPGTNAQLSLTAQGKVAVSPTLADQQWLGRTLTGRLGDGASQVVVKAGGSLRVNGGEPPVGAELGEEIARQVENSLRAIDLEAVGRQVSEEMEAALSRLRVKLESVDWEQLGGQARDAVERAIEQMQRDVDRLAEKAARQQQRLEQKAERQARRRERDQRRSQRSAPPSQPEAGAEGGAAPPGPVEGRSDSEDERLSILRMVEQGQITPAEAEMLLDALQEL